MTTTNLTLEQIWEKGCQGEKLDVGQQKRFVAMARSRFHTFQLGIDHANQQTDDAAAVALITGLASELAGRPGLKIIWLKMEVSRSNTGQQVSLQLEKLEQSTIH
jgi:hypothetical protein